MHGFRSVDQVFIDKKGEFGVPKFTFLAVQDGAEIDVILMHHF